MIRHLLNFLLFVLPPTRMFGLRRILLRWAGVQLGTGVSLCGMGWIYGRGELRIGAETWISPRGIFYTNEAASIEVGPRCDVGPEVSFVTGSHDLGTSRRRAGLGTAKDIRIGDGCWIGARSTILGGVTIGPGAIVAAGSMVITDVEPNTLVAGVPAVLKKHFT